MLADCRPVVALIPARGGSKGILRKNITPVAGQPLLAYTVKAALQATKIDETWVSSDDGEILALAEQLGAKALRRPSEHATDEAAATAVVQHLIGMMPANLRVLNPVIVYLQPTSPLRNARHIDDSLDLLVSFRAEALMSVVRLSKTPFQAFVLDKEGRLQSLFEEALSNKRRQDLPPAYAPNGAIYAFTMQCFENRGCFPSNGSVPYFMTETESVDIDTPSDIERAEQFLRAMNG